MIQPELSLKCWVWRRSKQSTSTQGKWNPTTLPGSPNTQNPISVQKIAPRTRKNQQNSRPPYHQKLIDNPFMATSLSFSNFRSFLLPSNPPPKTPPPPQLSITSRLTHSLSQKSKDKLIPLVAQEDHSHSGSLSPELASVTCPSLAYANTLFFKSAYNVQVIVDENEPEERLLNRFRREVMKAGVIQECKRRRFYENKQDEKKRKSREAAKRNRRRSELFSFYFFLFDIFLYMLVFVWLLGKFEVK